MNMLTFSLFLLLLDSADSQSMPRNCAPRLSSKSKCDFQSSVTYNDTICGPSYRGSPVANINECFQQLDNNLYGVVYNKNIGECIRLAQYVPCSKQSGMYTLVWICCLKEIEKFTEAEDKEICIELNSNNLCPTTNHEIKWIKYINANIPNSTIFQTINDVSENDCFNICLTHENGCSTIVRNKANDCYLVTKHGDNYEFIQSNVLYMKLCCQPLHLLPKSRLQSIEYEACYNGLNLFYNGTQSTNFVCLTWESKSWLPDYVFPSMNKKQSGAYCRNINGDPSGPWCYTFINIYKYCPSTHCGYSRNWEFSNANDLCTDVNNSGAYRTYGWCEIEKSMKFHKINHTSCKGTFFSQNISRSVCFDEFVNLHKSTMYYDMNIAQIYNKKCEFLQSSSACVTATNSQVVKKSCCKTKPNKMSREKTPVSVCYNYDKSIRNVNFGIIGYYNAKNYTSRKTETINGLECFDWTEDYHSLIMDKNKRHNYCRNIDNDSEGPWCLVNKEGEYGYCDISCGECNELVNKETRQCQGNERFTLMEKLTKEIKRKEIWNRKDMLSIYQCIKQCLVLNDCFQLIFEDNICRLYNQYEALEKTSINNGVTIIATCCKVDNSSYSIFVNVKKRTYKLFMWNYFFVTCGILLVLLLGYFTYIFIKRWKALKKIEKEDPFLLEDLNTLAFVDQENLQLFNDDEF